MISIALLVPVCSRNQTWKDLGESHIMNVFYPNFLKTKSEGYSYVIYVGIDDDDEFFLKHSNELKDLDMRVLVVSGCQHAPARVWNRLFEAAVADGHDYFFQIGDDVKLITPGWTERFIGELAKTNGVGVVGPCHYANYNMRMSASKPYVIENSFVSRNHWDTFGYFFHPTILNWFCDDWITQIYRGGTLCKDIACENMCVDGRYVIRQEDIAERVAEGRRRLTKGAFSFCVYGDFTEKYYYGLRENVRMIKEHYPTWDIHVYASPSAVEFVERECPGVILHATQEQGILNTLYRFFPATDTRYDVVFVRDTDSRIHERDRWCINHFVESEYSVHTTRDHPWHRYRIMAGLWGCKRNCITKEEVQSFLQSSPSQVYGVDAVFLEQSLYSRYRDSLVVYSYTGDGLFNDPNEKVVVIPVPIMNHAFCGQVMLWKEGVEYPEFQA